jgi:hypothetical protein
MRAMKHKRRSGEKDGFAEEGRQYFLPFQFEAMDLR